MKTKTNTTHTLGITAFLLACTVLLLSCGGSRSSKIDSTAATPLPNKVPDTVQVVKSPAPDDSILYVNDTTHMYKDITIFHYLNTGPTIIKFPNGKTLSEGIDNPIIKDIPKQFIIDWDHIKSSPTYGVIDIRKMDMKTKKKWFSKMDGMRHINKLTKGFYRSGINANYINRGIILKYTFIEVEEEIELNEDDWIQAYVGNVGVIEVYDLEANKLYEIDANQYGGGSVCITDDNKYIIVDSQGKDESDRWIFKQGSISIYSFKTGDFYARLLLPDLSSGNECRLNEIYFISAHNTYDSILLSQVLIHEKKVFTANILRNQHYKVHMDNGIFTFPDGTKCTTQLLSFEEWNNKFIKNEKLND